MLDERFNSMFQKLIKEPVIEEDKLETQEIPDIEEAIPEAPAAEDAFLGEVVAKEAANVESSFVPRPWRAFCGYRC